MQSSTLITHSMLPTLSMYNVFALIPLAKWFCLWLFKNVFHTSWMFSSPWFFTVNPNCLFRPLLPLEKNRASQIFLCWSFPHIFRPFFCINIESSYQFISRLLSNISPKQRNNIWYYRRTRNPTFNVLLVKKSVYHPLMDESW